MSILILIFSFLSSYAIVFLKEPKQEDNFRVSWLKTCVLYGVLIAVLTEVLSINQSLTYAYSMRFWSLVSAINVILLFLKLRKEKLSTLNFKFKFKELTPSDQFIAISVCLILSITLITAILGAPNNWDSMTYHLPRVMHWIQNQSAYPYPTNNLRQISFSPGAAYIVTQIRLLSGIDYFVNCVQWLGFLGSAIAVSLLGKILVGPESQWLSALLCVSIPMAIMQSMTTQTDLITGFWLVCSVFFIFRKNSYLKQDLIWISMSLSLAILTKPTAILFSFPFCCILIYRIFRQEFRTEEKNILKSCQNSFSKIGFGFLGVLSLSIPSYWRNYFIFDSFLGVNTGTRAEVFGITPFISIFFKNIWLNFPIPYFKKIIISLHENILDLPIDESTINFGSANIEEEPFLKFLSPHEDFVSSPFHFLLFCAGFMTLIYLLSTRENAKNKESDQCQCEDLFSICLSIFLNFILFSTLLKWQVWHNRLLLPLSILAVPIEAFFIKTFVAQQWKKRFYLAFTIIAIAYSLTPMRHPLISLPILSDTQQKEQASSILFLNRNEMYFSGARKNIKLPYNKAIQNIKERNCNSIALAFKNDDWEYPLWVLSSDQTEKMYINHIDVSNKSKILNSRKKSPPVCSIISTKPSYKLDSYNHANNWQEKLLNSDEYLMIYFLKENR